MRSIAKKPKPKPCPRHPDHGRAKKMKKLARRKRRENKKQRKRHERQQRIERIQAAPPIQPLPEFQRDILFDYQRNVMFNNVYAFGQVRPYRRPHRPYTPPPKPDWKKEGF